jgi:hypothetical protein
MPPAGFEPATLGLEVPPKHAGYVELQAFTEDNAGCMRLDSTIWEHVGNTESRPTPRVREREAVTPLNQTAMLADFARHTDMDVLMLAGRYTLLEQSALNDLRTRPARHSRFSVARSCLAHYCSYRSSVAGSPA